MECVIENSIGQTSILFLHMVTNDWQYDCFNYSSGRSSIQLIANWSIGPFVCNCRHYLFYPSKLWIDRIDRRHLIMDMTKHGETLLCNSSADYKWFLLELCRTNDNYPSPALFLPRRRKGSIVLSTYSSIKKTIPTIARLLFFILVYCNKFKQLFNFLH